MLKPRLRSLPEMGIVPGLRRGGSRWAEDQVPEFGQRRLERCLRDLLEPALALHPVSAIAARWGFADAASLSRTFRSAYHVSPSRYRVLNQEGVTS